MELALVLVLEVGGLPLAAVLARAAFGASTSGTVKRVLAAIERATRVFLSRVLARAAALAALALVGLLGLGFGSGHAEAAVPGALGLVTGAVFASAVALSAALLGARAAGALLARAALRFDLALATAVRTAGATGVVAQALGVT